MNNLREQRKEIFADTQQLFKSNVMLAKSIQNYQKHRMLLRNGELNALYNNDCIYTPDVTVFKT